MYHYWCLDLDRFASQVVYDTTQVLSFPYLTIVPQKEMKNTWPLHRKKLHLMQKSSNIFIPRPNKYLSFLWCSHPNTQDSSRSSSTWSIRSSLGAIYVFQNYTTDRLVGGVIEQHGNFRKTQFVSIGKMFRFWHTNELITVWPIGWAKHILLFFLLLSRMKPTQ